MIVRIPVLCANDHLFRGPAINFTTPEASIGFFNCIAGPCPKCGAFGEIVDGIYTATQSLIEAIFLDAFRNPLLEPLEDAATLTAGDTRLAFTTDSYVVRPLFFPGGDIGKLAVNGTVNDLAVGGACPLWLSAAFILEEGFPLAELRRVVESVRAAFHYVRSGRTVMPESLPAADDLLALLEQPAA